MRTGLRIEELICRGGGDDGCGGDVAGCGDGVVWLGEWRGEGER